MMGRGTCCRAGEVEQAWTTADGAGGGEAERSGWGWEQVVVLCGEHGLQLCVRV